MELSKYVKLKEKVYISCDADREAFIFHIKDANIEQASTN
jgi:hypothetical protein